MIVSQARIDANRRNSKLSTGPKPENRSKTRANALVHGLCSSVVNPEDASVVIDRARDFFDTLRPQNHFHCWLVTEIALLTFKIERAERMDRRTRDKVAIKAELSWDDDKRLEAELLGEQLANRPAVVVEQLRRTPQGCEWLMARWAMLAYSADDKKAWTAAQERLAFDLLATPGDFREGRKPGVAIDFQGHVTDPGTDPAAVARREIDALIGRMESVTGLDEANRALAMADLNDDHDAELKRVRRYEGTLHSRLRWCMRQLQEDAPPREVPRWLKQSWLGHQEEMKSAEPKSAPLPEPVAVQEPAPEWAGQRARVDAIHAPFELEPDEVPPIGQRPDFAKILADRRAKKLKKAEDRRDARRRKAEKLRA